MRTMKQRGDTIIEVLLAMSVIGMVLGTSYAIANRSLATGRLAQEQTEALKIAESQLEKLKSINENQTVVSNVNASEEFCIAKDAITKERADSELCEDGLYTTKITYYPTVGPTDAYFEVNVFWDREVSQEDGSVRLFYKLEDAN